LKPELWGSPLGQEKYHEEKACDKKQQKHNNNNNNNNNTMDIPRLVYSVNFYIVICKMK